MGTPKGTPRDIVELCARLTDYFKTLELWLKRRHPETSLVRGGPVDKDPPPKPPDLGP